MIVIFGFRLSDFVCTYLRIAIAHEGSHNHVAYIKLITAALSREVVELCEIQNCSGRTADAVSTKTSSGKQHASWTKVVRRGNRQTANTTGSRPQARATCTHPQQRDPQAQRQGSTQTFAVPVPDARRIWGTLKTTTIRAVEKVIGSLTKVPTSELKIKRKYKTTTDNLSSSTQRVFRWWFVVRAKESVLEQLQKEWYLVAMQTDWKLTPLLQYVKPNLQLPNQSNQSSQDYGTEYAANHGLGNAAASDVQLSLFDANDLANQQQSSPDKQTSVPIVHQSSHSTLNTIQQSLVHSSVLQSSIVPDLQQQSPSLTQTDEQTKTLPPAHNLSENSQTTSVDHSQTAKADITDQPLLSSSLSASSSCSSSHFLSLSLFFRQKVNHCKGSHNNTFSINLVSNNTFNYCDLCSCVICASTSTVPTCMHAHPTNLKILYFNARSIIPKRDELTAICTAEKPHIVCLTETWLDEDIGDHEICFGNYNIVRRDRNRHGGGVAMLIQNSLSFNILVKGTDDFEVIFVSLSCSSGKFCLGIFYRPPSSSVHILDTLENVLFNLDLSFLSNLVLLGDFNVDFHPFSTHPMYSHLCSLIDNLSLM